VDPLKIVLIGAGSNSFGRGTLADLMACREVLEARRVTVALVDTNEAALSKMVGFADALKAYRGADVTIEATTDRAQALPGADYVVTAVSVERNRLWAQDFSIPLAFGFRHPYGECGGPGAAFHTLRSLNLVVPICQDMERLCPDAMLLNFTNPENRVCLAARRLTSIAPVGLCHGPVGTHHDVAHILGRPAGEIEISVGGINHFHWVLGVTDLATGDCLLDEFHARLSSGEGHLGPLTRYCFERFGRLPFPSDSHTAEFLPFGYEFIGPHYLKYSQWIEAAEFGNTANTPDAISQVATGGADITDELAAPTQELVLPLIADMVLDRNIRRVSSNVPNDGCAVANLPEDSIVEVPVIAGAGGVKPVPVGPLPEAVAALCRLQMSIQELIVTAYAEKSREPLLQAMLLEPTVDDTGHAVEFIDEMCRLQAPYLPELAD